MVTRTYLHRATRAQLIEYLEHWGYQCYSTETVKELRLAALINFDTEKA